MCEVERSRPPARRSRVDPRRLLEADVSHRASSLSATTPLSVELASRRPAPARRRRRRARRAPAARRRRSAATGGAHGDLGADLAQPGLDRARAGARPPPEDAAAEQTSTGLGRRGRAGRAPRAPGPRPRRRAARRSRRRPRRAAASAKTTGASSVRALRRPAEVDRLGQLARRSRPEVRWNGVLERRLRAAAVLAARRGHQRGETDVVAAAPVAGDRPERGEAGVPSVRRDADAVDARAADDGHAPAVLSAGSQHRERVVVDDRARGPATRLGRPVQLVDLGRESRRPP